MDFGEIELTINFFLIVMILARRGLIARPTGMNKFEKEATVPLRALLAYCVITTHIPPFEHLELGTIAVSVFFFMSGYGMLKSYQKAGACYLMGHARRHFLKLMIPYFVCAIPWCARMLIGCKSGTGQPYGWEFIANAATKGDMSWLLPNSWFPWILLFVGFVASIALRCGKVGKYIIILSVLAAYYWLVRYCLVWPHWWWFSIWAFPVGFLYADIERKVEYFVKGKMLIIAGVVGLIVDGLLFKFCPMAFHAFTGVFVAVFIGACPLPRWKWLIFLGSISYEIYLVHGAVYATLKRVGVPLSAAVVLTYVMVPLVAYVVNRISAKIMTGVCR